MSTISDFVERSRKLAEREQATKTPIYGSPGEVQGAWQMRGRIQEQIKAQWLEIESQAAAFGIGTNTKSAEVIAYEDEHGVWLGKRFSESKWTVEEIKQQAPRLALRAQAAGIDDTAALDHVLQQQNNIAKGFEVLSKNQMPDGTAISARERVQMEAVLQEQIHKTALAAARIGIGTEHNKSPAVIAWERKNAQFLKISDQGTLITEAWPERAASPASSQQNANAGATGNGTTNTQTTPQTAEQAEQANAALRAELATLAQLENNKKLQEEIEGRRRALSQRPGPTFGQLVSNTATSFSRATAIDPQSGVDNTIDDVISVGGNFLSDSFSWLKNTFTSASRNKEGQSWLGLGAGILGGAIGAATLPSIVNMIPGLNMITKIPVLGSLVNIALAGIGLFAGFKLLRKGAHSFMPEVVGQTGDPARVPPVETLNRRLISSTANTPAGQAISTQTQSHNGGAATTGVVGSTDELNQGIAASTAVETEGQDQYAGQGTNRFVLRDDLSGKNLFRNVDFGVKTSATTTLESVPHDAKPGVAANLFRLGTFGRELPDMKPFKVNFGVDPAPAMG